MQRDGAAVPPDFNFNFIIAFDALNLFSVIALSAILLTAWLSPQIRRVATWYLYIFSWMVFSLGYLLILEHQTDTLPHHGLCLVQSMMIYATPAFASTSIVVFVAQIFMDIKFALVSKFPKKSRVRLLIAIPWIILVAILTEVLILGIINPDSVERDSSGMFCHLSISSPSLVTGIVVFLCIIAMLVLGVLITITIRRNRATWQNLRKSEPHSYDLMLRIGLFVLAPVIAAGVVLLDFIAGHQAIDSAKVNIVYAILPATASVIFSSQRDILRVWMIWWPEKNFDEQLPGLPPSLRPPELPVGPQDV